MILFLPIIWPLVQVVNAVAASCFIAKHVKKWWKKSDDEAVELAETVEKETGFVQPTEYDWRIY